jgi:hypothetical protein
MDTYLEMEMQEELCKRLFLSFVKRTPTKTVSNVEGKVIKVNHSSINSFFIKKLKQPTFINDTKYKTRRRQFHFLVFLLTANSQLRERKREKIKWRAIYDPSFLLLTVFISFSRAASQPAAYYVICALYRKGQRVWMKWNFVLFFFDVVIIVERWNSRKTKWRLADEYRLDPILTATLLLLRCVYTPAVTY